MKLETVNWNKMYEEDMTNGIGFTVMNPTPITKDQKNIDGIYSPLYGTELEDDSIMEKYRCQCKSTIGKFFEHSICPYCNTEVEYANDDIEKTGWISISYDIIQPLLYNMISKFLGRKNLTEMINYSPDIDIDGHEVVMNEKKGNPYENIGIIKFKEKFQEIMDHFLKINGKQELYDFIMENKENVFINKIPVFSLTLRPIVIIQTMFRFSDINRKFQTLITDVDIINRNDNQVDNCELKILPSLYDIQNYVNDIHEMILDMVAGKEGHIRGSILGTRVNFSARCVIIPPIEKFRINEILIPYLACLELYKYEILNLLQVMDGCTITEAHKRWHNAAQQFDRKIYLVMQRIIKQTKGGIKMIMNRPPTLNYGNILCMTVVGVKEDYNDFTVSIPSNILKLIDGDHDGDTLTFISIKDQLVANLLDKTFSPINMCISKNDGKFNRQLNLIKDQLIGLEAFCA